MLEAAATAIAKAIVAQATGQAAGALTRRLKARMRGDPVERAVAAAVGEAYAAVKFRHRQAAASLFDEEFLTGRGAPLLAQLLVPGDDPTGQDLAKAWSEYGGPVDARIVAAAEEFLEAFGAALDAPGRQEALRELRGYRAQQAIANATRGLLEWAESHRERAFVNPALRYPALDLDRFVGRAWLLGRLDEFLDARTSGYFVLEGGAGLGKSAFLAWLARARDYPLHFVALVEGAADPTTAALSNLAYQLSQRWEINRLPSLAGARSATRDVQPDEFEELLHAIAGARADMRRRDPVVFVIDGLDEVRRPGGASGNVLGLPARLPDGVFCIVSQRPVHVDLSAASRYPCRLETSNAEHVADLRAYVIAACKRERIAKALDRDGRAEGELIDALIESSAGVWLYAYHVLQEIEDGSRDLTNLENLPRGLWEFYRQHFGRLLASEPGSPERCELSVLCTLAAAQEALGRTALSDLAAVPDAIALDNAIGRHAAFLERNGAEPYRLYHDSARRFLSGDVTHETLAAEEHVAKRFGSAVGTAHGRIADHYLTRWGGLNQGLPGLRDQAGAAHHEGYGLRQLGAHLRAADRYEDLRELLLAEWADGPRPLSAWYEAHAQAGDHVRYLRDVGHARARAEALSDAAVLADRRATTLGDEYGYALLAASVASHTNNVPAALRVALVRRGVWSCQRALVDAQQLTEPTVRVAALGALAGRLDAEKRQQALTDAVSTAREIHDEDARARALQVLAPSLDATQLANALNAASEMRDHAARARALVALIRHLEANQRQQVLGEALSAVREIPGHGARARALEALAEHLEASHFGEALAAAREIPTAGARARALMALSVHLDVRRSQRALDEALRAAREIDDEDTRVGVLEALVEHLGRDHLSEALTAAREIRGKGARVRALVALAAHLDEDQRQRVVREALSIAHQIDGQYTHACALVALAGHLDADQRHAALLAARKIRDENARASAFEALACHLDRDQLGEALTAARKIRSGDARARALVALAAHLDTDQLGDALSAAREIRAADPRVRALEGLVEHLDADQRQRALDAVCKIRSERARARALVALAGHLDARQLGQALSTAREIRSAGACAQALGALADHLDANQLAAALQASQMIRDGDARANALGALADHLDADQLGAALNVARQIGDQDARAHGLAALAGHLAANQRQQAVGEALDAAVQIDDDDARAIALAALASHADASQLGEALHVARRIRDSGARTNAIVVLADHLEHPKPRQEALREALNAARRIHGKPKRARALAQVAVRLDGGQRQQVLREALDGALDIEGRPARAGALAAVGVHLDGDERRRVLDEALNAALDIQRCTARARALANVAAYLDDVDKSKEALADALSAARAVDSDEVRARALSAVAVHLDADDREEVLGEALIAAGATQNEDARASALEVLAGSLDADPVGVVLSRALSSARAIRGRAARARALSALGQASLQPSCGQSQPSSLETLVAWREPIAALVDLGRPHVLRSAPWAMPTVRRLGGPGAITACLDWMRLTSRWWP